METITIELGKTYVTENLIFTVEDTTATTVMSSKHVRFSNGNFWRCASSLEIDVSMILREANEAERLMAEKVYINGDILAVKQDTPKEDEASSIDQRQPKKEPRTPPSKRIDDVWEARRWEIGENVLSSLIREVDTKDLKLIAQLGAVAAKVANDFVDGLIKQIKQ